jgi:hypothetical protein
LKTITCKCPIWSLRKDEPRYPWLNDFVWL